MPSDINITELNKSLRKIVIVQDRESIFHTALQFSFMRAFRKLGYKCDTIGFDLNLMRYRFVNAAFPWLMRTFLRSAQLKLLKQIETSECDLVLVVKGYFLLDTTIEEMRKMGKIVVCFNPDDPFNTNFASSNDVIRNAIKSYDAYFIWSHKLIKPIIERGCANVYYLPFGVDDEVIKPRLALDENEIEQNIDISFIGGGDEKRIKLIRDLAARLNPDVQISIYGYYWPDIPGTKLYKAVFEEEYLAVMYRSKINLNMLRVQNEGSNNMRTFEIPATKSFMLHEHSEEAASFFEEGVEAEYYRSVDECAEKITSYLENEQKRRGIAEAGYNRIYKSGYLYENLMKDMLLILGMAGETIDND